MSENENRNICFSLQNVQKTFRKENGAVLRVDNLNIYTGEITAILGYSAAGKSTLMNIMALLQDYDKQADTVIHYRPDLYAPFHSLSASKKRELRREHFGFIFQEHHLIKHLSAHGNIMMPLSMKENSRKIRLSRVKELLDFAKISKKSYHSPPSALSGGESQRISVLRAIAHNPKVLFADEPTGSLDPVTGQIVIDMLRDWHSDDLNRTIIVVTHNFTQAFDMASRFIIFKNGSISFDGRKGDNVNSIQDLFKEIGEL